MIIFLSDLQKEHLKLLHEYPTQVLIDFCKLSLDCLSNGTNNKKINIASEKLNISVDDVQNLVHALIYLIVEGSKHNLSDSDFKSSLAIAGFTDDKQEVLVKLHSAKKAEISSALYMLEQKDPTYQDFNWRLEVQISSRYRNVEISPMITMHFSMMTLKNFGQFKYKDIIDKSKSSTSILSTNFNTNIHKAKAASHCLNVVSNILLQCDLPNLLHMTNKLEQALKESKSQHIRKVQRAL